MTDRLARFAFTLLAGVAVALGAVEIENRGALAAPFPSPTGSYETPPPLSATATPTPAGRVIRYSAQLLGERNGFVFFTTGDGFRLDPAVKVVDAATGGPTALKPVPRVFARAGFDGATGRVVELALSNKRLPPEAAYEEIQKYAIALSTPYPNTDMAARESFNGRPVLVVFTVEVPPKTPFGDSVYLATDVSDWSPTAIKMDRVDALHYRVARDFASGTELLYRYTRGSWRSAERGQDGLEVKPRQLIVRNADVRRVSDIVYHWGDENLTAPDLGAGIPTPFNPLPFPSPPRK